MVRSVIVKLGADVTDLQAKLANASRSVRGFTKEMDHAAKAGHLDAVSDQAAGMGLALAAGFGVAMKAVMAFDKQMSAAAAGTNASARDLDQLREAALRAGKDTQFSATQAAEGIEELGKAGVSTTAILNGGLSGALALAAAGGIEVSEAAETAASAMTQFKLAGSQIPHVADLLAAAAGKAQGSVHDMGMALNQAGLVSSQMGLSIEETTGTLASLASAGLIGSDAGTSLKTALMMLAKPTKEASELMDELGIHAYDAGGKFVGTAALAGQLKTQLGGLTQEQRNAALATIFGQDAIRAASVLYEQGADGIQGWIDKTNDAGFAAETAAKRTDNLAGDLERLKGSLETLAIESGGGASSGLRTLAQGTNAVVDQFAILPSGISGTITVLAGLGGAALLAGAGWVKMRRSTAEALTELRGTGPAGVKAARGLEVTSKWAGRAAGAFVALEVGAAAAGAIFGDQLNPQVEALGTGLEKLSGNGTVAGESARLFGDDLGKLDTALKDVADTGAWSSFARGTAGLIEGVTGTGQVFDDSLTKSKERLEALDGALTQMAQSGKGEQAAAIFKTIADRAKEQGVSVDELKKVLPGYAAALEVATGASTSTAGAIDDVGTAASDSADEVEKLQQAFDDLFDQQMDLDTATLKYREGMADLTKELKSGARQTSLNSEEGQKNRQAILEQLDKINDLRKARIAHNETLEVANGKYVKDVDGLRKQMRQAGFTAAQIEELTGKYRELPEKVDTQVKVTGADGAAGQVRTLKQELESMRTNWDVNVRTHFLQTGKPVSSLVATGGHSYVGRRHGGIDVAMAGGGITQAGIYAASNPPLVRFAEPETGGEGYVPKNGSRSRNLAIMQEMAAWPSVNAMVVPMDKGGIQAAASGLVNVARSAPARSGSRIESESAYINARDAVNSLNQSLKENGRALSLSTGRGRENRKAVGDAIQAAKAAAVAKYEETGSVRAANAAYAEHLERLKATLRQQGINAQTARKLVGSLATKPDYGIAATAPRNSSSTIAAVKDQMALADATTKAGTFFDPAWGKPTFGTGTAFGRDNLNALFEFLAAAEAAAQSKFGQTGSAKTATGLYNNALSSLRSMLTQAGMSKKEIDPLLGTYGRITLGNRYGGVYEHMAGGGLRDAHVAAGGPTRYAYAEPATGGELFAPKRGDLAKTRAEVGWAVQNWWGGQVAWQQSGPGRAQASSAGQAGAMTIHVVVNDGQVAGLIDVRVDQQLGALADAQVYATTA